MPILNSSILLVLGLLLGWLARMIFSKYHLTSIEQRAMRLKQTAEKEAEVTKNKEIYDAREKIQKERREHEQELKSRYREIKQSEARLQKKEDIIEQKLEANQQLSQTLEEKEKKLEKQVIQIQKQEEEMVSKLESIARLTAEEAHQRIIEQVEVNAKKNIIDTVQRIEQEAIQNAERNAKKFMLTTSQRLVSEVTTEMTISSVALPSEDMKGRIIGKEGRNIRMLETLTGANIIIDDTPDLVIVSCFNPIRRNIAISVLNNLVKDGRIHPSRIEEEVAKVTKNINKLVYEDGEKLFLDLGLPGTIDVEILRALGRLKFRTSYGQNMYYHSKEVAYLAGIMAKELDADVTIAKRGGLLHDIGKAIDSNEDITHVELGVDLAKRSKETPEVINCIAAHHGDVPHSCIESVIVQIADAMSASRPGARRDTLDNYIERLGKLESIANSFDGIEHAYAVHAGRELRVLVNHDILSDAETQEVARQICLHIEEQMQYPGRIKVTAIRETRIIDYAR